MDFRTIGIEGEDTPPFLPQKIFKTWKIAETFRIYAKYDLKTLHVFRIWIPKQKNLVEKKFSTGGTLVKFQKSKFFTRKIWSKIKIPKTWGVFKSYKG